MAPPACCRCPWRVDTATLQRNACGGCIPVRCRPSVNSPKGTASPHDAAFDTLLAIAHQMLQDNADAHAMNFDVVAWLTTWINQPAPALGWVTPASLMVTQAGVELVSDLLKSMASGAYR